MNLSLKYRRKIGISCVRTDFFSDDPNEEMLQSEFVTGTGITGNKKHLWNQASERFSEYIKDLKEIFGGKT